MRIIQKTKTAWRSLRKKYSDSPHRSFKATPRIKRNRPLKQGVREAWQLIVDTFLFAKQHRKFFIWLIVLYAFFTYFLVGGVSQVDYAALKSESGNFSDGLDAVTKAGAFLGAALTGGLTAAPSDIQRFLSGLIMLLFWLVTAWTVRMLSAGKHIKLRDAFYNGSTPLIPTTIILLVIATQLIPAAIGLFAFQTAVTQNWITSPVEELAFGGAAVLLCLLSLYWLASSVVATAIVALPGIYPLRSLADARILTMGKRWEIALRLVSMLIIQVLIWGAILLPVFMLDTWLDLSWLPLVPIIMQVMSGFSIIFTSIYIYKLYRSLL